MARPLRVEYPGAHDHVINRGNGQETIFKSQRDRETVLHYRGKTAERFSLAVHTSCLMDNHYHLLGDTPQPNLRLRLYGSTAFEAGLPNQWEILVTGLLSVQKDSVRMPVLPG